MSRLRHAMTLSCVCSQNKRILDYLLFQSQQSDNHYQFILQIYVHDAHWRAQTFLLFIRCRWVVNTYKLRGSRGMYAKLKVNASRILGSFFTWEVRWILSVTSRLSEEMIEEKKANFQISLPLLLHSDDIM